MESRIANHESRILWLRRVSQLLDSAFAIPGTSYRVGLDPIVGLVPWVGDLVSPLFTLALLWQAREMALPRVVQLRMVVNVAIDALVGAIPILGDLFDFAWKANDKNMALLERHAFTSRRASVGDWLFVTGIVLVLLAIAAAPFVIAVWLLNMLRHL
jgi:Domain of unknown function (DUF4112)